MANIPPQLREDLMKSELLLKYAQDIRDEALRKVAECMTGQKVKSETEDGQEEEDSDE